MRKKILDAVKFLRKLYYLFILLNSNLFDKDWYLYNNVDVLPRSVCPYVHYMTHGGFEGRDPSLDFSSSWYLDTYPDVKDAGINPLVHYLLYGKREGRICRADQGDLKKNICPVCQNSVEEFLPLPSFFMQQAKKYGYPYSTDDAETMNAESYSCPICGASDRDRLCAVYLQERISSEFSVGSNTLHLLDIAPSLPLSKFIRKFKNVVYKTADLLVEGVDFSVDITNMPEVASNSYDIFICSHVLEHVEDDKKALSELYRVLKPGGWGIIMAPIILAIDEIDENSNVKDIAERWRRFGQNDHVRLYSKEGFIKRVKDAGFTVKQFGVDYFGEVFFKRYGITDTSVLYVGEKQQGNKRARY